MPRGATLVTDTSSDILLLIEGVFYRSATVLGSHVIIRKVCKVSRTCKEKRSIVLFTEVTQWVRKRVTPKRKECCELVQSCSNISQFSSLLQSLHFWSHSILPPLTHTEESRGWHIIQISYLAISEYNCTMI